MASRAGGTCGNPSRGCAGRRGMAVCRQPTNRMVVYYLEATTLGHLVDRQAAATPEREALVFPDARLTYGQLAERTDAFARALAGLGVTQGDKVGILLANRLEFVLALFGAAKLGAVVVPVNARFKVSELSHVIAHSDARVLITAAAPDGTDYP